MKSAFKNRWVDHSAETMIKVGREQRRERGEDDKYKESEVTGEDTKDSDEERE